MISFFIPVYNYEEYIKESVASIMNDNFEDGDELIIVNDGSADNTARTLEDLKIKYPEIKVINHSKNRGGAVARNTAIRSAKNKILFCLDADNVLVSGSIKKLKEFMISSKVDIVAFQEIHFFNKGGVTGKWKFKEKITLKDYLSTTEVPGASGNYMFTKESWLKAGGYPEGNWLDTWGFGFRQAITGSEVMIMPNSYYYHRHGHDSYWKREHKKGKVSLEALKILIPFLNLIDERDVNYIMSPRGRYVWFERLAKHSLRLAKTPKKLRFLNKFGHLDLIIGSCKEYLKKKTPYLANIYRRIKKYGKN